MAELVNEYVSFREGWLKSLRAMWFENPCAPLAPGAVDAAWCKKMQTFTYKTLNYILHQTPKFVVTDFATAEKDKSATIGLTTWACTWTGKRITIPDEFVRSTTCTTKPSTRQKAAMLRLVQRMDNDWIAVPVLAFMSRLVMASSAAVLDTEPTMTADAVAAAAFALEEDMDMTGAQMQFLLDNGGGHVGLVEFDTPRMPVLQFAPPPGAPLDEGQDTARPVYLTMTRFEKMNALRVGSRMLDPIHGTVMTGKQRVGVLDVDLTMFLLWQWYKGQNLQQQFEAAVQEFMGQFRAKVVQRGAEYGNPAPAVGPGLNCNSDGDDVDDLDALVRYIDGERS